MLFDAHYHAFSMLGGVPERGIYDNMKTAVDKVGRSKERSINKRFQAMVSHYLSVVQRKPGALRNGAPFSELPENFGKLQEILLRRPSKQHVLNCLGRLSDAPRPQPLMPPATLRLVVEPIADNQRYDRLRKRNR